MVIKRLRQNDLAVWLAWRHWHGRNDLWHLHAEGVEEGMTEWKEWLVIIGIFLMAIIIIFSIHLSERDSLIISSALNILNCGDGSDGIYFSKTNECVYRSCLHYSLEEQIELHCRHSGLNITEEYLYRIAEKGDLA